MRASRGLKWENKMYKLKRSIERGTTSGADATDLFVCLLDCLFCRVARAVFFLLLTEMHERGTIWRTCADGQLVCVCAFCRCIGLYRI